jgi:hypothetical protein
MQVFGKSHAWLGCMQTGDGYAPHIAVASGFLRHRLLAVLTADIVSLTGAPQSKSGRPAMPNPRLELVD